MKRDLAVGAGPQLVPRPGELALDPLEIVELAVHHDVAPAVLARDRLITGHQIDDAESGMAEPDPAVGRDPLPAPVRAPVMQSRGGALERFRRDAAAGVIDRHNATHSR